MNTSEMNTDEMMETATRRTSMGICPACGKGRALNGHGFCRECDKGSVKKSALRNHHAPLFHLVPLELMEAVAETRAHGDRKYAPSNWQQGGKAFFVDSLNHAIAHLMEVGNLESKHDAETHLGHAACNIAFVLWAMKRGILTRRDFRVAAVGFPTDQEDAQ